MLLPEPAGAVKSHASLPASLEDPYSQASRRTATVTIRESLTQTLSRKTSCTGKASLRSKQQLPLQQELRLKPRLLELPPPRRPLHSRQSLRPKKIKVKAAQERFLKAQEEAKAKAEEQAAKDKADAAAAAAAEAAREKELAAQAAQREKEH